MADAVRKHTPSPAAKRSASASAPSATVFVVSSLAGFAAAGSVFALEVPLGLGVGVAIGLAGAGVCAALAARGTAGSTAKATALLDLALSDDAPSDPPAALQAEPWASLYREVSSSAESKRTASMAVLEIERLRRGAEDRTGLEAHEPPPAHRAEDLVGHGETTPARDPRRETAATLQPFGEGLESIESELVALLDALRSSSAPASNGSNGSPSSMVDALVRTAADGIEDLAAGLMRANELAGVAERVTNRATLLALNAALEATRSGSEAFASIAEETRRLAEYAREATDTISRLSGEIEFKVGETIASIQSSSEDAKAAVASMGSEPAATPPVTPATIEAVETLVARVRAVRRRMSDAIESSPPAIPEPAATEPFAAEPAAAGSAALDPTASEPTASIATSAPFAYGDIGLREDAEPEPMVVTLDASADEAPAEEGSAGAPSSESDAPDTNAVRKPEAKETPFLEPKIPDWLEGIGPGQ